MFERVLYSVLTESVKRLETDSRLRKAFIKTLSLDQTTYEPAKVEEVLLQFAGNDSPVIHSYAREDTTFPVFSLVMAAEQEDTRALGDETGDKDDHGQPIRASLWNSTHQVLVYAKHPDVTIYLYALARAIMISRRVELIERADLTNMSALSGAELSPDAIWLPEFLFVRAMTVTVVGEQRALPEFGPGSGLPLPIKGVTGLHVRDPSIPNDGLTRTVEPYVK